MCGRETASRARGAPGEHDHCAEFNGRDQRAPRDAAISESHHSPPQQLHPQTPDEHDSGTHVPLLQVSLQGQTGLQIFAGHFPFVQVPPPAQPHLPPQPSPAPQVPSVGPLGLQHEPP